MRINIATGPWLPVPAIQGGAVHRLWQGLAEEFAAKGHQVSILCRAYPGQPATEVINNVTYIRRGGLPQSTNIYWDLIKDFAYAVTNFMTFPAADITVINDFWLPVFVVLRPQLGKIVINCNRFPKGQFWLYRKVDRFDAASLAIKEAIIKQDPMTISKIEVVPNPIDTSIFSPPTDPRNSNKSKTILYVGRIHPEKGIHLLLEAFALLQEKNKSVDLVIIGPFKENQGGGGEDYLSKLKAQAAGLPIQFLEPVFDSHELAKIYHQADLFCYPSLAEKGESFGVAPLEAMATGLVPIVSSLDCFKDFIEEGKTGYFFNHRSVDAAKNLAKVFQLAVLDWEQTMDMGINATQKAQSFSHEKISDIYLADFAKLINISK